MSRLNAALRCLIRAKLWEILSLLASDGGASVDALTLQIADKARHATLIVGPPGDNPGRQSMPGKFLSPAESAIWLALAEGPLVAKQIASRTSREYDSTLRGLLANLIDRGVLTRTAQGYARAMTKSDKRG